MQWLNNLYLGINNGINNPYLSKFLLSLIFLIVLLMVPIILSFVLPIFKKQIQKTKVYLYAFSTGFFIILASFGFLRESLEVASHHSEIFGEGTSVYYLSNIGMVGGGILVGLTFAFVLKFVISSKLNKQLMKSKKLSVFVHEHKHSNSEHDHTHSHEEFLSNREDKLQLVENTLLAKTEGKLKLIALLLLLTHRIPEGLLIGYNLSQVAADVSKASDITVAYFISLILHLIPEETIFYLRLRDAGFSPWKALFTSFAGLGLFLPFILIGIYGGDFVSDPLKSLIYSGIGGIFIFTSLVEFFPEFYHEIFNKKKWFITLLMLFLGVVFSVIILSIHSHGH
ncbi:ZIP family metal transporter [Mycoplasma sp. 6243]|uniref:ZIP family metal transporter n=1 Tax=Mycoplasma sp. 6243 TaxID=3440865 RepID=UPI003EC010CA